MLLERVLEFATILTEYVARSIRSNTVVLVSVGPAVAVTGSPGLSCSGCRVMV